MTSIYHNVGTVTALAPAVHTAAVNGATIDLIGFETAAFVVTTGAVAGDGDFGLVVQESINGTDWVAVDAADLDHNMPATLAATATYKVGYRGHQRYIRLNLTKAGGNSIALAAIALRGDAHQRPVA